MNFVYYTPENWRLKIKFLTDSFFIKPDFDLVIMLFDWVHCLHFGQTTLVKRLGWQAYDYQINICLNAKGANGGRGRRRDNVFMYIRK